MTMFRKKNIKENVMVVINKINAAKILKKNQLQVLHCETMQYLKVMVKNRYCLITYGQNVCRLSYHELHGSYWAVIKPDGALHLEDFTLDTRKNMQELKDRLVQYLLINS